MLDAAKVRKQTNVSERWLSKCCANPAREDCGKRVTYRRCQGMNQTCWPIGTNTGLNNGFKSHSASVKQTGNFKKCAEWTSYFLSDNFFIKLFSIKMLFSIMGSLRKMYQNATLSSLISPVTDCPEKRVMKFFLSWLGHGCLSFERKSTE